MKFFSPILWFLCFNTVLFAQDSIISGVEHINKTEPCLTDSQRGIIIKNLKKNIATLKSTNKLLKASKNVMQQSFAWPLKIANNLPYNEPWNISAHVDHDSGNGILDYNGGNLTYNGHKGTDIATHPFPWYLMDIDGVEVVAAASGQIINKFDGRFDRNCVNNNDPWNAVYIKHNDGSVAFYGHLKNGSVTTKNVGDMVSVGETLGVVGSSGNSSGPHLHFEIYSDDSLNNDKLIDPFAGPSNPLNTNSWWQSQLAYRDPKIVSITTNSELTNQDYNLCNTTVTPNDIDNFDPGDLIYFHVFFRFPNSTSYNFTITEPNGSVFNTYQSGTNTGTFQQSYNWNSRTIGNATGIWKIEYNLMQNGSIIQTIAKNFTVGGALSTNDNEIENLSIYPNPVNNKLSIKSVETINTAILVDAFGRTIFKNENASNSIQAIDTSNIPSGLYFLILKTAKGGLKTIKLIKT